MATPPDQPISLVTEQRVRNGTVNVVDCHWPHNLKREDCGIAHRLGLSLGEVPEGFRGRFKFTGCRTEEIGRVVYIPSGIPLEATSAEGHQRIAGIHFDDQTWVETVGLQIDYTSRQLEQAMNLRSRPLQYSLRRIADEVLMPGFASGATLECLITIALVDLCRLLAGEDASAEDQAGTGIYTRKLGLVEERIRAAGEPIPTVAELAKLAGWSPRHLLRAFQEDLGETLRSRLQRESSIRACHLLRASDLPIKTISWRLGFRSQGNFTNAFRRMHGETPTGYRARFR